MHTRRGLFFSKAHKTDCILCWFIFVHNNIATIYKSKNISATYAVHWSENTHIYAAKTQSVLLHPQMSFLCLILSRSFVESTYCSATTKTYPFRKNDAIALIETIEVFVATCPRSVRTKRSRHFRRRLFLRFYSLIVVHFKAIVSNMVLRLQILWQASKDAFIILSSLFDDFYTKPQSNHPSLSKHDQVTAIAFLAQRPSQ